MADEADGDLPVTAPAPAPAGTGAQAGAPTPARSRTAVGRSGSRSPAAGRAVSTHARPLKQRILDAATDTILDGGWEAVTMAGLGARAGVSRQSVYNEVGSKPELAHALVMRELTRFLAVVERELSAEGTVGEVVSRAALGVFRMARDNPVLLAAVSSAQGSANDLLPLLTTRSSALTGTAAEVVVGLIRRRQPPVGLSAQELATAVSAVVRLVLSLMMRPSGSPEEMAAEVGWVAARLLADGGPTPGQSAVVQRGKRIRNTVPPPLRGSTDTAAP